MFLTSFNFTLRNRFFQHQYQKQEKICFYFIWFLIKFVFTYSISLVWSEINCRSSHWRCSVKKYVLKSFTKSTGKHLCQSLFFNKEAGLRSKVCNFIKKKTLAQVFSCEFWELFKNTFCTEHLWTTTSVDDWFWNLKH